LSLPEIAALKTREPMGVKKELAARIVADFHSATDAKQAEDYFVRETQHGAKPMDIKKFWVTPECETALGTNIPKLLVASGTIGTRTEAERLIKQGAVEINGQTVTQAIFPGDKGTVRVGKHKWLEFFSEE